ncbi:hypothetical protein [Achromobacter pulmonis]|uniref:hypothetical protein n=1 Tax=Achromobacter pulmonis TaxID=1389932 RepID=UPI001581CB83|nr:hypothetical protein [Achromobacter pulmonis]
MFYDLSESSGTAVVCAHVYRDTDERGTEFSPSGCEVDEKMGTMALLAPRVKQLVQDVREQVQARHEAELLAKQQRPKIFVEGESDRIVLQRCASVFHPQRAARVDFETKRDGAGHSYVIDMLNAWRCQHKHNPNGPRAVGILDGDAGAAKREWNEIDGNTNSAKAFCYPKPAHAVAALQAHFRLAVTLEVLYPIEIWNWAERLQMLEDRSRADTYPPDMVEQILKGELENFVIDEAYRPYVTRQFSTGTKITCAQHVARMSDAHLRAHFDRLGALIGDALDYLLPAEA